MADTGGARNGRRAAGVAPRPPGRAGFAAWRARAVGAVALLLVLATAATARGLETALGGAGRLVLEQGRPWVDPATPPGAPAARRTVTVVTAPGLDLELLRRLAAVDPTWRALLEPAAVALMTTHTGGYYGREAGYLTLGAGARAVSGPTAGWVLAGDQVLEPGTAASLFDRWWPPSGALPVATPAMAGATGGAAPPRTGPSGAGPVPHDADATQGRELGPPGSRGHPLPPAVHWGWQALRRANEELDHPVPLGSLADALHRAGLKVAALGNADLPSGPWAVGRPGAALMAADGRGWIDLGLVDDRGLEPDPSFPGGWRTDWGVLMDGWQTARQWASLIVVEAGDLGRLDDLAPTLPADVLEAARLDAGRRLGRALAAMRAAMRPGDGLLLLNPAPADPDRPQGKTLLPAVSWGVGAGLLTSPSTRRAGVVANTDVAPMVAAHLGAPPHPAWIGRPWSVVPARQGGGTGLDALDALDRLNAALVANYQRRAAFIRLFVGAGLVLTAGPLIDLWRRRPRLGRWPRALLSLAAFPLGNLLLPAWPAGPAWVWWSGTPSVVLAAGLAIALAAAARRLAGGIVGAFGAVGLWTAAVTVADALAGGWLAQLTPFGYSPIGGARYYGIGNEYMGVLIGSTAVAAAAWAEARRRRRPAPAAGPGARRGRSPVEGAHAQARRCRPSEAAPPSASPASPEPAGGPAPSGAAGGATGAPRRPSPRLPGLLGPRRVQPALSVPLALAAAALVLADPRLGGNFGGALSAAVAACGPALAAALAARRRARWRVGAAFLLLGAPAAAGVIMGLWDRQLGSGASHVMTTWEQVRGVGPGAVLDVVARKVTMNLRLMRYTNWSYLFVMLVFAYAFVIYRRAAVVRQLERQVPEAVRGLAAVAAGSLAALVLNDSGIVAAATTLVYGATLLLALAARSAAFPEAVAGPAGGAPSTGRTGPSVAGGVGGSAPHAQEQPPPADNDAPRQSPPPGAIPGTGGTGEDRRGHVVDTAGQVATMNPGSHGTRPGNPLL
ncbi:hypothetical protein Tmar_1101 [Thermaerobacter marianensis DSM 12885]|uniref:Uncharacterized protein n=1 Tax=Thermaerobacter marianensis (strain ATCC 700841 / DSM 12885 / JCM 10246 / 7p75a) TaxID=644966 RepID=E6SK73_THEM7|nr:hypothetical protein [Thermaerobacter marianensis]ADU51214.1 hypothetical protein Tmar_1101 [Thermaerobacter marianensis DSM 12885]